MHVQVPVRVGTHPHAKAVVVVTRGYAHASFASLPEKKAKAKGVLRRLGIQIWEPKFEFRSVHSLQK